MPAYVVKLITDLDKKLDKNIKLQFHTAVVRHSVRQSGELAVRRENISSYTFKNVSFHLNSLSKYSTSRLFNITLASWNQVVAG